MRVSSVSPRPEPKGPPDKRNPDAVATHAGAQKSVHFHADAPILLTEYSFAQPCVIGRLARRFGLGAGRTALVATYAGLGGRA